VDTLKLLGRVNGAAGFPLAEPYATVQADTTGDDMHMVIVGIPVPDCDILMKLGKSHFLREVGSDCLPFLAV
jgi:predicted sugar kinase